MAVETLMGENSYYLLGRSPYAGAPTVTAGIVSREDVDMFSVLINRTRTRGYPSTIGAVASQANQFGGYSQGPVGGITKYNIALNSLDGSAPCDDLTDIVNAMNYVLQNGSQLASSCIYWKAINQGNGVMHVFQPGDINVGNTAFGTGNTVHRPLPRR